ncbi:MAG TPA: lamin tail domain-containing protein [Xanthomonadales bacterium]|nr:lamin tail domain-containing protein [Xanthomonadales bacterium]
MKSKLSRSGCKLAVNPSHTRFTHPEHWLCLIFIVLLAFTTSASAQVVINEIRIDQPSTDNDEYFELAGTDSLNDLSYIVIGDGSGGSGTIESVTSLAGQSAVGGFFVAAEGSFTLGTANLTTSLNFENGDNVTHLLVSNFSGSNGDDVDTNDDGTLDVTPWSAIVDCVALVETLGSGNQVYCATQVGPDGSFLPAHVKLCPGGWEIGAFDPVGGSDTPGATNACSGVEIAPSIVSTNPLDGATGVAIDADIEITFSEAVMVVGSWFNIECDVSGTHTAVTSGGPVTFTLNPDTDYVLNEVCTVDVFAAGVSDVDTDDPPDNMEADYQFSFDTVPAVVPDIVINEFQADPAGDLTGDANGDGVRDATQDEFVEIVNASGGDLDVSGWVLSDGFGPRHVFPAGSVIADGCSAVVFGGGTPTGSFGNSLVQTASDGALGLNNGGDTITLNDGVSDVASVSYGGEGGNNQSLTLDPDITGLSYVQHSSVPDANGALFSPGTKIDGSNFDGCPSSWVINEFLADPAGDITGDANGDGERDGSEDEFVEIVNGSAQDMDISGWRILDAVGVRHTFPTGSVVLSGCSVTVFGGGTPTGMFGGSLVQTASSGFLGFNNGGDSVILDDGTNVITSTSYGSEGGDNQSLTLDPDVTGSAYTKHSVASGSGGSLFSPGTKINGDQFDGCPVTAAIFEIQGAGSTSPFVGNLVTTLGNTVTAVGPEGFFMQSPDASADADPNTSEGIYVFTDTAPAVAVGDNVDVTGEVVEFFDFTQFGASSVVTVVSSGNPLPTAVVFNETVPSPDPMTPSCAIEYECYEGMLIELPAAVVTGPNQGFGSDPIAEIYVTAGAERTYREPGIEFPGLPGLPEWDGNPEVFEIDPDKLGLPNQLITAGSTVSATGALGYEFGGYEIWATSLTADVAPVIMPVREREAGEMTVGALNMFRLFNDVDDGNGDNVVSTEEYMVRLAKLSDYVRNLMDAPDILAVSEVERLAVLQDLADTINVDDPTINYTPYLEEGNDVGGIDVGFLVLDTVMVDSVTQLGKDEILDFDMSLLNDRPPLLLEGRQVADGSDFPIAVMAIHGRSLNNVDNPSSGERVRQKRLEQAQYVAQQVQLLQDTNPDINLVVTGDFNAFEFTDGYVDVTGHMKGVFTPEDNLVCDTNPCTDYVLPDLINQVLMVPAEERYSFIFRGNAQVLDHALTSEGLDELVRDFQFVRGNADVAAILIEDPATPLRSSDHDGLVLFLEKDSDGDGVTDGQDFCPGTMIPEAAPTVRLGVNNFALVDDDRLFDTKAPPKGGPGDEFDIFDTAGCSCEQIVVEAGLGVGHLRFGCSVGEMRDWVEFVNQP